MGLSYIRRPPLPVAEDYRDADAGADAEAEAEAELEAEADPAVTAANFQWRRP